MHFVSKAVVLRFRNFSLISRNHRRADMANAAAEPSDGNLLRLMVAGDRDAFAVLYRRYRDIVFRFALQMSGSDIMAQDVTQDVFLAFMRHAGRYDPAHGLVSTYLYGMARHMTRRRLRRERRFARLDSETQAESENCRTIGTESVLDDFVRQEEIEQVRRAVVALPSRYREVIVLCDLHDHSYAEAAAIIGCAVGTVRSRLNRGRVLLHDKLEGLNRQAWCAPKRSPGYCV
jgi:RNA polymerase sigma-70 factor, ECF subfamily